MRERKQRPVRSRSTRAGTCGARRTSAAAGGSDFGSYMRYLSCRSDEISRDGLHASRAPRGPRFPCAGCADPSARGETIGARELALRVREPALGPDHQHEGACRHPAAPPQPVNHARPRRADSARCRAQRPNGVAQRGRLGHFGHAIAPALLAGGDRDRPPVFELARALAWRRPSPPSARRARARCASRRARWPSAR